MILIANSAHSAICAFLFTKYSYWLRRYDQMTTNRMNLLSLRSISLDRTFVVDIEYQSVCPFVGIGSPHPRKRVCLPPLDLKGGATLPRGWGVGWEDPIRTTGKTAWHSVNSVVRMADGRAQIYKLLEVQESIPGLLKSLQMQEGEGCWGRWPWV